MHYATTVSNDPAGTFNENLKLISVDVQTGRVKVRSDSPSMEAKIHQLTSEDAKTLAILEAQKAGMSGPMLKHSMIMYGDDKTGEASKMFVHQAAKKKTEPYAPFLVVEVYSPTVAETQFQGDSL